MDAMAYHVEARAPFHFGLRGVGIEATALHGPSDTFFSALCHTIRQQFGLATLQDFLTGYSSSDPPLLLSSAFPYVLNRHEEDVEGWAPPKPFDISKAIRFFPRPLEPPPGVTGEPKERKTLKKIAWVSEGIFRTWIGGESLKQHYDPEHLVQGRKVWLTTPERKQVAGWRDDETDAIRLWAVGDVPRVTVDRRASTSAVYQAGRVCFQPGGGLWLLMRWREDWQKRGELALQVLGDAGVGGERSAGHGLFRLHGPHPLPPLPDPTPGERFLTLSLYYPTEAELTDVISSDGIGYRLQVRRGWMASPDQVESAKEGTLRGSALRRKAVRMFGEGSILRWPEGGTVLGALADVTPDAYGQAGGHDVWRYGLAYAVGYQPEGGAP